MRSPIHFRTVSLAVVVLLGWTLVAPGHASPAATKRFPVIGCTTNVGTRGGKVMALCRNGYLPNGVIRQAPSSAKLHGKTLHQILAMTWTLGGNAGISSADVLGTTDDRALILVVNGQRTLRIEPRTSAYESPNILAGDAANVVSSGVGGATISGGGDVSFPNAVNGVLGTVSGGRGNSSSAWGTVGGGETNRAGGLFATVAGGDSNMATGNSAVIGGGNLNVASGVQSTAGGGLGNEATQTATTVAGGYDNKAVGSFGTVPGGVDNVAGPHGFAAGTRAKATHTGSFVWADDHDTDITAPHTNQFIVRASNGVWFGKTSTPVTVSGHFIDTSVGGYLSNSGVWTDASSRAIKHDFRAVSPRAVLAELDQLPVNTWSYKTDPASIRHVGPVAEDFYRIFRVGQDRRHIAPLDEAGVALAAIKALHTRSVAARATIRHLRSSERSLRGRVMSQGRQIVQLQQQVAALLAASRE